MSSIFTTGKSRSGRAAYEALGLTYRPTTGEVFGAAFDSALEGPGSAVQDVAARTLAKEFGFTEDTGIVQEFSNVLNLGLFGSLEENTREQPGKSISEEEWKADKRFFREGLQYRPGMTTLAAEILANRHDRQLERDFILQQSSGLAQGSTMVVGMLAGGIADAKNVAVTAAVAAATPLIVGGTTVGGPVGGGGGAVASVGVGAVAGTTRLLARVGTALTRTNSAGLQVLRQSRSARLAAVLGESTVSVIPQAATGIQNAPLTQEKYNFEDAAVDFVASAGLGAGFYAGGEALRYLWKGKANYNDMVDTGNLALRQLQSGEKVDVQPIVNAQLADFVPEFFPPTIRRVNGAWQASYGEAEGVMDGAIKVRAATPEAARAEAESLYVEKMAEVARQRGADPNLVRQALTLRKTLAEFDPEAEIGRALDELPEVQAARRRTLEAERRLAEDPKRAARLGPVIKLRERISQLTSDIVQNPENYAMFDDRVKNAFVELDKAKKALARAGGKGKAAGRQKAVDELEARYQSILDEVIQDPQKLSESVPELRGLKNRLTEAEAEIPNTKLRAREARLVAERDMAAADLRNQLEIGRPKAQSRVATLQRDRRATLENADTLIRHLQKRAAIAKLPEFAARQLDDSVEARAARSVDPKAREVVAERVEKVDFDPDAPAKPVDDAVLQELRQLAETDKNIKMALNEVDELEALPDTVQNYLRCRAGR